MASTGGPSGYDFTIPELADNANIQTALRLYHLGYSSYNEINGVTDQSVVGQLQAINTKLDEFGVDPTDLGDEDLDGKITSGFYHQTNASYATYGPASNNYPVEGLIGMLRVTADGDNVYQQYHTLTTNQFFVRTSQNSGSTWFEWKEAGSADFVGHLMLGGM